jgi:hypothetical protein
MKRYRLFQGKLREHDEGEWVLAEYAIRLQEELERLGDVVCDQDRESIRQVVEKG